MATLGKIKREKNGAHSISIPTLENHKLFLIMVLCFQSITNIGLETVTSNSEQFNSKQVQCAGSH